MSLESEWENEAVLEEAADVLPESVLIVGASSIRTELGLALQKRLNNDAGLLVHRHAKVGTGLARPDVYDWKTVTLDLIHEHKVDLVIAQFIGNDCQALINRDQSILSRLRSPNWGSAYTSRVSDYIKAIQSTGAQVVLLGMPIVRATGFRERIVYANAMVKAATEQSEAHFLPTYDLSTTSSGAFRKEMRVGKRTRAFRQSDGIHFSRVGARFVADEVYNMLLGLFPWTQMESKE